MEARKNKFWEICPLNAAAFSVLRLSGLSCLFFLLTAIVTLFPSYLETGSLRAIKQLSPCTGYTFVPSDIKLVSVATLLPTRTPTTLVRVCVRCFFGQTLLPDTPPL